MADGPSYAAMLRQLLPPGAAWSRDPASKMGALMLALAQEPARLDARALDLIEEADPRTTNEILSDWERVAGLPDPNIPAPTTLAARQTALLDRLVSRGGLAQADFINLIGRFGYAATITTHTPFAAGVGYAGGLLYDTPSIFWWAVNVTVPVGTVTPIGALENAVRRQAPDHTYPTFNYSH